MPHPHYLGERDRVEWGDAKVAGGELGGELSLSLQSQLDDGGSLPNLVPNLVANLVAISPSSGVLT